MHRKFYIIIILVLIIAGCKPPEEEPLTFDFKHRPGAAVVGHGNVSVVYSDDARTFNTDNPIQGGIQQYYFNDNSNSYISGSEITFTNETGEIETKQDTFGLDPFFSPFNKTAGKELEYQTQLFATEEGIIVQKVMIYAHRDIDTFIHWKLYTPAQTDSRQMTATDILEDGIYHRYDNDSILAIAGTDEHSQFTFNTTEDITTVTTPLSLKANRDTTLTFFITAGSSDTEVITKMFAAEENDLFDNAYRYWNTWLAEMEIPAFPHEQYKQTYVSNLYAVYASALNGTYPAPISETSDVSRAQKAHDHLYTGEYDRAEQLINEMIEHANSYGLIPATIKDEVINPVSPIECAEFIEVLHVYFSTIPT